jgi:hypothetical protein
MSIVIENSGDVKIGGRKIAKLRNGGALCDIRRYSSGFLYSGGMRVAVVEELLETLEDTVILQFVNMDTKDVWTCTVHDFRHWAEPVQYTGFEPQRAVEIARMNHTVGGSSKKRKNELLHVDVTPVPEYRQPSLFI